MRTPVHLVVGQGDTTAVVAEMLCDAGTVVIGHRFDGHVVQRWVSRRDRGQIATTREALELAHGCASCTIRDDLLILLRKLHRRDDVRRIVVHCDRWLEPEPLCWAINNVRVAMGFGYVEGPAARDVEIAAVINCVDTTEWITDALGDDELPDGRTVAQVIIAQAEFADVLLVPSAEPEMAAVLARLSPRARVVADPSAVRSALMNLTDNARRGRSDDPHDPLLAGQPTLDPYRHVELIDFQANRPFHPERLHDAVDILLDGVIRARGRMWLASNDDHMMFLESAGGGLRVSSAGLWMAAMTESQWAYVDPVRSALAAATWDEQFGDRHTSIVVLTCGAQRSAIVEALSGALLTDREMQRPDQWSKLIDPFGDWHEEPCRSMVELGGAATETGEGERP